MGTEEKSRDAHQPTKRYAAVGMQQGRVLLDDDFNEAETIRLEEGREVNLDVIGPAGSPDNGFHVSNEGTWAGGIDFAIADGTMYVSGIRTLNPSTTVRYSTQPDWLQQPASERPAPVEGRVDLIYLEVWRQPVTAIEDSELFEVALAGPDTSTRMRTMWRVHVAPGVDGDDCPGAWANVRAGWAAAGLGKVDENGERLVDAQLEIGTVQGTPGDLCTPSIAGGYLGAENQTIRVQLVDADHFTWGFDNAAPLYRATLAADNRTLKLLTDPRDRAHWPLAGQVVEVLPWGAVLTNGEKIAEDTGWLARVETSFDPDGHTLKLTAATAVPAGFGMEWMNRQDHVDLGKPSFFVRVWNRGDDHASKEAIPFVVGTPVALGTTGLTVTITGADRVAGDHWIIAARPRTPDRVVPWELTSGRGPTGVRRFFAPLALVRWHAGGSWDLLHDCRPYFPPLTRINGCCTYTVGDGTHSFGRFTKIQQAIDALPDDGGKVCVLAGEYRETVELRGKTNITIEGCGARSVWHPREGGRWALLIAGGSDITVRDIGFDTGDAFGIVVVADAKQKVPASLNNIPFAPPAEEAIKRLRFHDLTMQVGGRSAIVLLGAQDVEITGCEIVAWTLKLAILASSDVGRWPAILSFADDVLIERNRIVALSAALREEGAVSLLGNPTFTRTALGGIQIGGGSERVEIRRNHIDGGNGNGVTLGSWAWVPRKVIQGVWWNLAGWSWVAGGFHIHTNDEGCIEIVWDPDPPGDNGGDLVPVSMGAVDHVRIVDNEIEQMGMAGIGVARYFDLHGTDQLILVRDLHVQDNRIHDDLRLPVPELPPAMRGDAATGAIALAEVEQLVVRGNDIAANGKRHIDPICGVFALISSGVNVENNRIIDNGPEVETAEPVRPGWRGGVVLPHALAPTYPMLVTVRSKLRIPRQDGQPAVRIADNVIVVPEGRAVLVLAQGAVAISDNELTTRGPGLADIRALLTGRIAGLANAISADLGQSSLQDQIDTSGGLAVFVANAGISNELGLAQLMYLASGKTDLVPLPNMDSRPNIAASGNILFHGNQVGVDLMRAPANLVLSGLTMFNNDDIQASENQVDIDTFGDRVLVGWYAMAYTVRMTSNRVKEVLLKPYEKISGTSITTVAYFGNMTTNNQTSRCIAAGGPVVTDVPNHVVLESLYNGACGRSHEAVTSHANEHFNVAVVEWS